MPVTAYGSLCRSQHLNITPIFERRLHGYNFLNKHLLT